MRPQPAVHLYAGLEILRTQIATVRPGGERKWPANSRSIAKFKRCVPYVLFRDEVFGDRPPFEVAAQDQLGFELSLFLVPGIAAGCRDIVFPVVANHFQQSLVGAADVFKLHIEHRVDPVLAWQHAKAVLDSVSREKRGLACRGLAIQVKLAGPPALYTVFQFRGSTQEAVTDARFSGHAFGCKLQISRLFHLVGIGDEEWPFGGPGGW